MRTPAAYFKNLCKILPAIRYIKMYSVYLSIYQDISCISCSFCKLHVRNSVSYCKKSRQGASSYPLYQDIQRISHHILRHTLYILQSLQVACEKFGFLLSEIKTGRRLHCLQHKQQITAHSIPAQQCLHKAGGC